jgi:hypothetical protein
MNAIEQSRNRYARLAGFMFLFVIATYIGSMMISRTLQVPGNFAETARRINASEHLYRFALSLNLLAGVGTLLLAFGLYVIVKDVDANLALLALLFRTIEAALTGVSVLFGFTLLRLYGADITEFSAQQLSVFVALRAAAGTAAYNISATFFGVASILYFYLFLKTRYIPRILSIIGLIGSVLIAIICYGALVWPQYAKPLQYGWIPMAIAEISVGVLLLVRGVPAVDVGGGGGS